MQPPQRHVAHLPKIVTTQSADPTGEPRWVNQAAQFPVVASLNLLTTLSTFVHYQFKVNKEAGPVASYSLFWATSGRFHLFFLLLALVCVFSDSFCERHVVVHAVCLGMLCSSRLWQLRVCQFQSILLRTCPLLPKILVSIIQYQLVAFKHLWH